VRRKTCLAKSGQQRAAHVQPGVESSMYRIVRVELGSDGLDRARPFTLASGFTDEASARQTAQDWLSRRFADAVYNSAYDCWELRDADGDIHYVIVERMETAA